jgi:hypothetical protein
MKLVKAKIQVKQPVLRIRDILGIQMLIGILGAVPLTNESGCGSGRPKTYGSNGSGTLVHLQHSSKIKSHKEVTKQQQSRFSFLLFLLDDGKIRIRTCD